MEMVVLVVGLKQVCMKKITCYMKSLCNLGIWVCITWNLDKRHTAMAHRRHLFGILDQLPSRTVREHKVGVVGYCLYCISSLGLTNNSYTRTKAQGKAWLQRTLVKRENMSFSSVACRGTAGQAVALSPDLQRLPDDLNISVDQLEFDGKEYPGNVHLGQGGFADVRPPRARPVLEFSILWPQV